MATTYVWTINQLTGTDPDTDNDLDIILSTAWTLTGTDTGVTHSISGVTPLNLSMTEGGVPGAHWPSLTEAEVIAAVQTAIGTNQITLYHENIDAAIAKKIVVTAALPWTV